MDPKYEFDPKDPSKLGPKYYFEPSLELQIFERKEIENLEQLIRDVKRNINATTDSKLKEDLNKVLKEAEFNLKKNRFIYNIEYFNELYNHLKNPIIELGVRYVTPKIDQSEKPGIFGAYETEVHNKETAEWSRNLYMNLYKDLTKRDYVIGSYKNTAIGYGRKLKGKGVSNPWIEFVKKNRGRFSSLKELSVLYHNKHK